MVTHWDLYVLIRSNLGDWCVKSPCKKICKLIKRVSNGEEFCVGCGRTREEIKMWTRWSDEQREAVIERLRVK